MLHNIYRNVKPMLHKGYTKFTEMLHSKVFKCYTKVTYKSYMNVTQIVLKCYTNATYQSCTKLHKSNINFTQINTLIALMYQNHINCNTNVSSLIHPVSTKFYK